MNIGRRIPKHILRSRTRATRAYRAFDVHSTLNPDDPTKMVLTLRSTAVDSKVARPVASWLTATCNYHGDHQGQALPVAKCTCGFYAFKTRRKAHAEAGRHSHVIARVSLAGRRIEHQVGWRAERMLIEGLVLPRAASVATVRRYADAAEALATAFVS